MTKGTGTITHSPGLIFKVKLPSDLRKAKHMKMNHLGVVSSSLSHSDPVILAKAFPLQMLSQLVPEPILIKVYKTAGMTTPPVHGSQNQTTVLRLGDSSQMALVVKNKLPKQK